MVRKVIGASSALILLAVTVAVLPQRGKADDVDKVLVVNGPKRPVPVTGADIFTFGRTARAYAEPGNSVTAFVERSGFAGVGGFQVTVTGYLVDLR